MKSADYLFIILCPGGQLFEGQVDSDGAIHYIIYIQSIYLYYNIYMLPCDVKLPIAMF